MTRNISKFCRRQQKSKNTKKYCINGFPYWFSISISICRDSLLSGIQFKKLREYVIGWKPITELIHATDVPRIKEDVGNQRAQI